MGALPKFFENFKAVQRRHRHVDQHDVRAKNRRLLERLLDVGRGANIMTD